MSNSRYKTWDTPLKRIKQNIAGFTLLETMAATLILGIVVIVFTSVFLDSTNTQRRAFNIQQSEENINFILESMAKEIRVGQIAGPDTNCPSAPADFLSFQHPVNGAIQYSLDADTHEIIRSVNGVQNPISSNAVEFTRLQFCVTGTQLNDKLQPRVTIVATVRSKNAAQQTTVDIQTTLSQRFLLD
jgi:type II secretory pathway pseudopilin PulG